MHFLHQSWISILKLVIFTTCSRNPLPFVCPFKLGFPSYTPNLVRCVWQVRLLMSGKLPKEMLSELKPFAWLSVRLGGCMTCAICKVTWDDMWLIYDIGDVIFDDLIHVLSHDVWCMLHDVLCMMYCVRCMCDMYKYAVCYKYDTSISMVQLWYCNVICIYWYMIWYVINDLWYMMYNIWYRKCMVLSDVEYKYRVKGA